MLRSEVSITKIIGITGPTGAGKTTALNEVERLGGAVIDCDAVYHELLESDIALQSKLEELFGPLRGEDGTIDRKKLGAIVFGDPEKLELLNTVAQRATVAKTRELVDGCEREGRPLAAIDAIALLEGISEDYAWARVRAQKPDDYFIKGCDYTLWNDCAGPEEFGARVRALLEKLFADKEV